METSYKLIVYCGESPATKEYANTVHSLEEARQKAKELAEMADNGNYPDCEVAIYPYDPARKAPFQGWYNEDVKYPYNDYRVWKRDMDGEWTMFRQSVRDGVRLYAYLDVETTVMVGDEVIRNGETYVVCDVVKEDGERLCTIVNDNGDTEELYEYEINE